MGGHDLDLLSLLFGLLFTGIGLLLLGGGSGLSLVWAGPMAALVLAGVIVAAAWPRTSDAAHEQAETEA